MNCCQDSIYRPREMVTLKVLGRGEGVCRGAYGKGAEVGGGGFEMFCPAAGFLEVWGLALVLTGDASGVRCLHGAVSCVLV
jgi:hypothetical protein